MGKDTASSKGSALAIQFFHTQDSYCWSLHRSSKQILHLLEDIQDLTDFQKHSLIARYITITEAMYSRSILYAYLFHIGRTIVSVGSLIVPALLSIQYTSGGTTETAPVALQIYWATWCISLLVTMFNGILAVFKVDKKYYFLHTIYEHLQSELWQYIHLSGKYGGHYTKGLPATHANQYVFICHNLEKIKLKQVEEEYYKLLEHANATHGSTQEKHTSLDISGNAVDPSKVIAGLYTPTPNQNQLLETKLELATALGLLPKNTLHPIQGAVIQDAAETISKTSKGFTEKAQASATPRLPGSTALAVSV